MLNSLGTYVVLVVTESHSSGLEFKVAVTLCMGMVNFPSIEQAVPFPFAAAHLSGRTNFSVPTK